ncbi:hypothetical protein, partial [Corynebacterium variabile]|uniref:hypothetical protein n=1 Tax=Corynebacterium variabile TaxID=1727 RepID=UPI003BB04648
MSFPASTSAGSPVATNFIVPSLKSGANGPGVDSWIGQYTGDITIRGVSGCASRIVSRNPWTAGPGARRRIRSALTRSMPSFTLMMSASRPRYRAGDERVQQRTAAQTEVVEVDVR